MSLSIPAHSSTTPLFLLMAEARAILARPTPQQKAIEEAFTLARHHRCAQDGCTTTIHDVEDPKGFARQFCWEHNGKHRPSPIVSACLCGSRLHGWCITASRMMSPNQPGARLKYAEVLA